PGKTRPAGSADAPPKPRKRQPSETAEPVDVARLLSIAPAEGPLSTALKSVGWRINPRLLGQLTRKGVRKVGDVLFLLPRVYEDRRRMKRIAELIPGERGVTVGTVLKSGN